MVTADDVREVGLALPRTYEAQVRGRWKLRVGQIVYVAFSPRRARDGLRLPEGRARRAGRLRPRDVLPAAAPATCATSGCARTSTGSTTTRCASWSSTPGGCARRRCCTTSPSCPRRRRRPGRLMEQQEWGEVRGLLHPYLHCADGAVAIRGRTRVLAHLKDHPTPRPPRVGRGARRAALPLDPLTPASAWSR